MYDAKKLLKEEFSYMQSEVYGLKDEIADFNALTNLTADGDIIQVLVCPVGVPRASEAAKIRQYLISSFGDQLFWDRKDSAFKLYGQYADLCDTSENTVLFFCYSSSNPGIW